MFTAVRPRFPPSTQLRPSYLARAHACEKAKPDSKYTAGHIFPSGLNAEASIVCAAAISPVSYGNG